MIAKSVILSTLAVAAGKPFHHDVLVAGLHPGRELLALRDQVDTLACCCEFFGSIRGAKMISPNKHEIEQAFQQRNASSLARGKAPG